MAKIKKTSVSALKKQNAAIKKAASAPGATKTKGGVMKNLNPGSSDVAAKAVAKAKAIGGGKQPTGWKYSPAKGGTPPGKGVAKSMTPTDVATSALARARAIGGGRRATGAGFAPYRGMGTSSSGTWRRLGTPKSTPSANYKKYWAMKKQ